MALGISYTVLWSYLQSRHFLARVVSTFLCSILVVIRPFSKYGGNFAFLALTIKELDFAPQDNLAHQLEALILNMFGGLIGIGISLLGNFLASLPDNTALARTIPAIFLTLMCFSMGWLKSALPRLTLPSRLACFISVWMLIEDPGAKSGSLLFARYFVWLVLTAALTSFCTCLVFVRWSTARLAQDIASALSSLHQCLEANLQSPFQSDSQSPSQSPSTANVTLTGLRAKAVALNSSYQQASFELRVGRIGVKSMKPLVSIVEHLRREMSWGMTFPHPEVHCSPSDAFEKIFMGSFHQPATDLGHAILDSISLIRSVVLKCYDVSSTPFEKLDASTISRTRNQLIDSVHRARNELEKFCDDLDKEQRMSEEESSNLPPRAFNLCLYMISLLQMAEEVERALNVGNAILYSYQTTPVRLWHPHLSLAWFGVAPSTLLLEENESLSEKIFVSQDLANIVDPSYRPSEEVLQAISDRKLQRNALDDPSADSKSFVRRLYNLRLNKIIRFLWNKPITLHLRLKLHQLVVAFRKASRADLKHAFKNALGVSVLAIPAFLPASSAGRQWFMYYRGQWMLISYIWVLQTNTGATLRIGYLRMAGTVLGALYGYIASLISQNNPYALVALVTLAEIPISAIIIHTSSPSFGVVAIVTLPPILFSDYITGKNFPTGELATIRGIMICAGIAGAVIMNGFVFPRHARVIFLDGISQILDSLTKLYMSLSRDLLRPFGAYGHSKRKTLKLELRIRNALQRMSNLITTMGDELSLVPIPMKKYRHLVRTLQKLLDLFTGLRKIRENIPRRETVIEVVEERRELISCICVSLFACEQVFGARHPLPQFLPSYRLALEHLKRSIDLHIRNTREKIHGPLGLSLIYALAETNIMTDIVDTIDELLELSRELFGTAAWFDGPLDLIPTMSLHEQAGMP
ncbi:hypothetical protein J3R30DRAFT_3447405 [Lentinula aciculospora]|uniref:DUF2421 domain-containing protein n=1 Tax=Lentinula aciculospora TaxID=153920 RepID=A0A9W9DS00_9AGAR|nr:hypothetical protein J3R30DRAFT_3447405 [Lentinula aciculospora]